MTLYYRPYTPTLRLSKNNADLRRGLCEAQNWRCAFCSGEMTEIVPGRENPGDATVDHYVPHRYGGTYDPENLVGACRSCNETRGCMHPLAFYKLRVKLMQRWAPCTWPSGYVLDKIQEHAQRRRQVRFEAARTGLSRQAIGSILFAETRA